MLRFILLFSMILIGNRNYAQTTLTPSQVNAALESRMNNAFIIEPFPYLERPSYKLDGYTDSTTLFVTDMAICKMQCLNITETEVRKVLKDGYVDLTKSYLISPEK